jgi:hypothetical protein
MEFFIPSLLVFLLAMLLTFLIVPRATPLIAAILSIIFLSYGVYDHYKMFASEYRLSTWQQSLKIYAPAIMISAIIIFIIYSILAFFTTGSVPVPPIPNIEAPSPNTITNAVMESLNKVANTLTNAKNDILDNVNDAIDNVNVNRTNLTNMLVNNTVNNKANNKTNNKTNKKSENNLSRSFLETI